MRRVRVGGWAAAVLATGLLCAAPAGAQPVPYGTGAEGQTLGGADQYRLPPPFPEPLGPAPRRRPVRFHRERTFHTGLLAGGASLFAFSYVLAVIMARAEPAFLSTPEQLEAQPSRDRPLYAPFIGPAIALGHDGRPPGTQAFLAVDLLAQAVGLGLVAGGLALRRDRLVADEQAVRVSLGPGFAGVAAAF